jgi:hypothetical protein
MLNPNQVLIAQCIDQLQARYLQAYGNQQIEVANLLRQIASTTLTAISQTDAAYHNVEHTVLVVLTGQEILFGKLILERNVFPQDWLQLTVALLCHDIGYLRGVCQGDETTARQYVTGSSTLPVKFAPSATDASLAPYHLDRGKQFVMETFTAQPLLEVAAIQEMIEATRFPASNLAAQGLVESHPMLARAEDLIGQLSDPRYLERTQAGKQILRRLQQNVATVEREATARRRNRPAPLSYDKYQFC